MRHPLKVWDKNARRLFFIAIGLGFIYSYDVNINALKIANSNTHEITIFYNMNSKNISKHLKFINNPRFL